MLCCSFHTLCSNHFMWPFMDSYVPSVTVIYLHLWWSCLFKTVIEPVNSWYLKTQNIWKRNPCRQAQLNLQHSFDNLQAGRLKIRHHLSLFPPPLLLPLHHHCLLHSIAIRKVTNQKPATIKCKSIFWVWRKNPQRTSTHLSPNTGDRVSPSLWMMNSCGFHFH